MLGTAIFRNLNDLETWLKQLSMEDGKVLYQSCLAESNGKKDVYGFLTYALKPDYWLDKESTLRYWQEQKQRLVDQARKMASYCASYGQQLYVREWHDGKFALLHTGNPDKCVVIPYPERFLNFTPARDYSGLTPAALRAQLNASGDIAAIVPAGAGSKLTQQDVQSELDAKISELNGLKQEMEDVRNANVGGLVELKRQMEKLQAKMEAKKKGL